MDYKKEIIEMIQKIHNESIIKFIYGCVKEHMTKKGQEDNSRPCILKNKFFKKITQQIFFIGWQIIVFKNNSFETRV